MSEYQTNATSLHPYSLKCFPSKKHDRSPICRWVKLQVYRFVSMTYTLLYQAVFSERIHPDRILSQTVLPFLPTVPISYYFLLCLILPYIYSTPHQNHRNYHVATTARSDATFHVQRIPLIYRKSHEWIREVHTYQNLFSL